MVCNGLFSEIYSFSSNDLKVFVANALKTETDTSKRAVIVSKIYNAFVSDPNPDTWAVMDDCINDLKINDEKSLQELVMRNEDIEAAPTEYVANYTKALLETVNKLGANGLPAKLRGDYIYHLLADAETTTINQWSEDLELLHRYFFNPAAEEEENIAGIDYAYNYLLSKETELESRLFILCTFYEDFLKEQWDVPNAQHLTPDQIKGLSRYFVDSSVGLCPEEPTHQSMVMETILKSFLAVLKPDQDFDCYMLLTFGITFNLSSTVAELSMNIKKTLENIVQEVGSRHLDIIAKQVRKLIKWHSILYHVDDQMYEIIENLIDVDNAESCVLAGFLLFDL